MPTFSWNVSVPVLEPSLVSRILHAMSEDALFATWFMQNLLDVLSTRIAVGTGRAIELNILANALGGPFSMASLIIKMLIAPIITYLFYRIFKQCGNKSMAICMMIAMNAIYMAILTNNFAVLRSLGGV
jgi:hypothetical protein